MRHFTRRATELDNRSCPLRPRLCCVPLRLRLQSLPGILSLLLCATGMPLHAAAQSVPVVPNGAVKELCRALRQREVPAAEIGLPTHGAVVLSAGHSGRHNGFCKLRGEIRPIDPAAQAIRFELNLPDNWNGKALQYGGGTFDGYVQTGLNHTAVEDRREPIPLARGYATFGSDSGHHHHYLLLPDVTNSLRADFALNLEQRRNYGGDALKKAHDTAVALLRARYGQPPRRMYFIGGSTGGREAMVVVDRWPADYDGVLAAYPAWNTIEGDLQFIRVSKALYARGADGQSGWLPQGATRLLAHAVQRSCDAADGLRDGIVSDPADCHFDPATLRCRDGRKHHGCLSDGQLHTVETFATSQVSDFLVAPDLNSEPGYDVLNGADLSGSLGLFPRPLRNPELFLSSFSLVISDSVLRYFLVGNPHYNALEFDPETGSDAAGPKGRWVAGMREQALEEDGSLGDLTPFARHGGKLLLVHGTADTVIPTEGSVQLYQRIVAAMGQERTAAFLRLYLVPGLAHGFGTFNAGFDTVGVLDTWADQGRAPAHLEAADNHHGSPRARPLCPWPSWPQYAAGDPRTAESFRCAAPSKSSQNGN